jgi:hypothetical protein
MDQLFPASKVRARILRRLLARSRKPLVITSSFGAAGDTGRTPVNLEQPPEAPLPYGRGSVKRVLS